MEAARELRLEVLQAAPGGRQPLPTELCEVQYEMRRATGEVRPAPGRRMEFGSELRMEHFNNPLFKADCPNLLSGKLLRNLAHFSEFVRID